MSAIVLDGPAGSAGRFEPSQESGQIVFSVFNDAFPIAFEGLNNNPPRTHWGCSTQFILLRDFAEQIAELISVFFLSLPLLMPKGLV
jgi:hypothetical protein